MFPPPYLVAMFGLAQHYGIQTRLLDWTWKPLVAAYFAAEPVAWRRVGKKPPETEAPYFSVFCLRDKASELTRALDPAIHILTVPTATNANLHAQGGQFSLVSPRTNDDKAVLPAIDTVLRQHAHRLWDEHDGKWHHRFPLLVELRVPVREARTAMLTLSTMGVNGATVFPGLSGVAKSINERATFQWAEPDERS